MKKLILIAMTIGACSVGFAENRITGKADPAKRCTANPAAAACVALNQQEVDKSCITPEERDTLNSYGAFAQCYEVKVKGEVVRVLSGWCACGCFSLDTKIAVTDKETGTPYSKTAWETARNRSKYNLISLSESYQFGSEFSYQQTPIALSATGPEKTPMFVIKTDLGQTLSVTENHPILRADFKMTKASNLKVGDVLLTDAGARTKIVKINRKRTKDPVVNFVTTAATDLGHIIFAEGLTVGDMKWQATLTDEEKAVEARK